MKTMQNVTYFITRQMDAFLFLVGTRGQKSVGVKEDNTARFIPNNTFFFKQPYMAGHNLRRYRARQVCQPRE